MGCWQRLASKKNKKMKNAGKKNGRSLYFTLFSGTAIIVTAMLLIDYRQDVANKASIISSSAEVYSGTGEDINKLLLSANELTIAEKTSLINLYLKTGEPVAAANYNYIKEKREEVYRTILKRQINKANNKGAGDFFIKPVPR
jgi:hypothetical protein